MTLFPELEPKAPTAPRTSVRINPTLMSKFRELASDTGLDTSSAIRLLLNREAKWFRMKKRSRAHSKGTCHTPFVFYLTPELVQRLDGLVTELGLSSRRELIELGIRRSLAEKSLL